MLLEMGMDGGALFLITRIPSFTDKFTGSHLLLYNCVHVHFKTYTLDSVNKMQNDTLSSFPSATITFTVVYTL